MPEDIHERIFRFAVRVVKLHHAFGRRTGAARTLLNQLLRASTSVGANLEEGKAAQSKADFISKCRISLKEAREAHYWLRLLGETFEGDATKLAPLIAEANEIVAILTTIVKNATTAALRPPPRT